MFILFLDRGPLNSENMFATVNFDKSSAELMRLKQRVLFIWIQKEFKFDQIKALMAFQVETMIKWGYFWIFLLRNLWNNCASFVYSLDCCFGECYDSWVIVYDSLQQKGVCCQDL